MWVFGFHLFYRWMPPKNAENLYPWNLSEYFTNIFRFGYLGVNLFFAISGFVIAQSLNSSPKFSYFWLRRFVRIWPSLIIISSSIFLIGMILKLKSGPGIQISLSALLSSITMIDARILTVALPFFQNASWITGVLWSLWVEINFYFLMSVIYFKFSLKSNSAYFWIFCFIFGTNIVDFIDSTFFQNNPALDALFALRKYVFWFYIGIAAYSKMKGNQISYFQIFVSLCCNLIVENFRNSNNSVWNHFLVSIIIIFLHALFLQQILQIEVKNRYYNSLGQLGNISYEMYLVHEFILLAMIDSTLITNLGNRSVVVIIPYILTVLFLSKFLKTYVSDAISAKIKPKLA